jgi:Holliday junction resolvase-like predicted endonuclease
MARITQKNTSQVDKKHIGKLGEEIVVRYLLSKGYTIVQMNYLIKGSEIDIVVKRGNELIFCEVKTSRVLQLVSQETANNVSRETYSMWENITKRKITAMKRAIPSFREKHHLFSETVRLFGFVVELDMKNRKTGIKVIPDINI